jgi:hypothetical protein
MFRALLLTAGVASVAVAAPVPKATPAPAPKTPANLTLGTATLDGTRVKIAYEMPPGAIDPLSSAPPRVGRPTLRTTSVLLASVKVTTADGKELTGDDLTKKLGESPAVARSTTALDPEWKKLFADDILFIEPNGKAAVGGLAPAAPGGGAIIRPLPIRRGAVLPPVEEPPVEKKEEKKEEKK